MNEKNYIHFGTISVEQYSGSLALTTSGFAAPEKQDPQHAYQPHLSYENVCKTCEGIEAEHHGAYKIAEYLKKLCGAHRTLSPVLERQAQYWFELLTDSEKITANAILEATGSRVWLCSPDFKVWELE